MRNSIYVRTNWVDNKTPINAANLNKIENAISDLYTNALSASDFTNGSGIELNITSDKKLEFSVSNDVMKSNSCCGVEIITEEPTEMANGVLYFMIDSETKILKKIIINGIAIYEME